MGRFMKQNETDRPPDRSDRRIHAALPIRVTYWDKDVKPRQATACTYDISPRGARVTKLPEAAVVGDILAVEQGRNKACCRVVWVGDDNSQRQGQMGIQCIDPGATLWESELRYMREQYDPMVQEGLLGRMKWAGSLDRDRRKYQRFQMDGLVELIRHGADTGSVQAELKDLSSFGCLVQSKGPIVAGTDLKLSLSVANYELSLKGRVLHASGNLVLGIEFREIRKGDRQLLDHLLQKLTVPDLATMPMAQAAGTLR
jgi:PilZ domain-containing protein